jgi:hypothetical protein
MKSRSIMYVVELLLLGPVVLGLAACGSDDNQDEDRKAVRASVQRFVDAARAEDAALVCSLFSKATLKRDKIGDCVAEWERGEKIGSEFDGVSVGTVRVDGDKATAETTRSGRKIDEGTFRLVREQGEWKITASDP